MSSSLPALIERMRTLRAVVIGDGMLDSYLEGSAGRLCREAPVPVVAVGATSDLPGGAANTAANVAALGAKVSLISAVGPDAEGRRLRQRLRDRGVSVAGLFELEGSTTLTKRRVLADGQLLVRFDEGHVGPLNRQQEDELIRRFARAFGASDAVIVSDYGYGVMTARVIDALARLQRQTPRPLVVDAKDLTAYRHVGVSAIKPNYEEAISLLGIAAVHGSRQRVAQIEFAARRLFEMTGAQRIAVTLDIDGAFVLERGAEPYRTYTRRPEAHSRAAGAGDTFLCAFALALAARATTASAAELASAAAALVVGKERTAICSAAELRTYFGEVRKELRDVSEAAERVALERQRGRRIVFTNGCFDILHRGHVTYLSRAKALGDVLIVGVNSDRSVCALKGASRPINSIDDRLQVLSALSCVDQVIAFDDDTPEALIRAIRPDVFVKGGDYTRETLPEAALVEELGGTVQLLAYVEDRSTTGVIARIKQNEAGRHPTPALPGVGA